MQFCFVKKIAIVLLSCTLAACVTQLKKQSELQQGKRYFETGYYKRALQELLPLACDGNAEAEYAVGYSYYYGYGVAQDTDVGTFWIKRSADRRYVPAEEALKLMSAPVKKVKITKINQL